MQRLSILVFSLCFVSTIYADNWPQFRGPGLQGHSAETAVPLKWSATENVAWKTAIPGESWSSPIIWGDVVFLTTTTESGKSCRVIALDRKSGSILWNKEVFTQVPRKKEGRNSYATPTPVTDGERVYASFGDGSFVALNFQGDILWTNRDFPFYSQHGLGSSPILVDGLLVMSHDGSSEGPDKTVGWQKPWDKSFVVALDAATGKVKWKTMRGQTRISHGSPTLWKSEDGKNCIVTEAGDVVQGLDVKTGELLWTHKVAGEGKVPSTLVGDGFVFTAGGWGGKETIKAFALTGTGDLGETQLKWELRKGMPKVPSMIYQKPYLYAMTDQGVASCIEAATGKVVWQERVGGNFSASPVAAAGRLYFLGDSGETVVLAMGPKFEVLAKNPLGERVQASPAISKGQFFIRTDKHLWCIKE